MAENELLSALEAFVDDVVDLGPPDRRDADRLRAKLDVLERVVELLRLRTGWNGRRVLTRELLAGGMTVEPDHRGRAVLRLGRSAACRLTASWPAPSERRQSELHVPLLLYLLEYHRDGTRIADLLVEFVNLIREHLSPEDVETTGTGVTRIMTTTRAAARTLRAYGLLTDSDRVAYRTWELSVFGILVAVRLRERKMTLALPRRSLRFNDATGPHGASWVLADVVSRVVGELADPARVAETLQRVCRPNIDVLDSFQPAIDAVSAFCQRLAESDEAKDPYPAELMQQARAMTDAVAAVVPPAVLADDIAKHFAIQELLG